MAPKDLGQKGREVLRVSRKKEKQLKAIKFQVISSAASGETAHGRQLLRDFCMLFQALNALPEAEDSWPGPGWPFTFSRQVCARNMLKNEALMMKVECTVKGNEMK